MVSSLTVWLPIMLLAMTFSAIGLAAPAASARGMGSQPLDDIRFWADQKKACGLGTDQFAAMMLTVVYPEAGASGEQSPSPMTLSRYDTQSGLYAFGDKNTPWQRAFWHPGVGLWAFDSAGGWNLTAVGCHQHVDRGRASGDGHVESMVREPQPGVRVGAVVRLCDHQRVRGDLQRHLRRLTVAEHHVAALGDA